MSIPYERVKLARDSSRPTGLDYIRNIFKRAIPPRNVPTAISEHRILKDTAKLCVL